VNHWPTRKRQAEVADVLVVQHTADCPPARVGQWLEAAGCRLDVRRCYDGDPLPLDLTGHDGLLVLGGAMGADDDDQFGWLGPTKRLLSEAVRRDLATLAICLGLQLLAVAEGGSVAPAAAGPQVGLQPVCPTAAAVDDPLFGALRRAPAGSLLAAHWNNDVVTAAPSGAVALAVTDAGPQAFRLGHNVWAVQFHPEVDAEILRVWAAADVAAGLLDPGLAEDRLAAVAAADDGLVRSWRAMTQRFAGVVRCPA